MGRYNLVVGWLKSRSFEGPEWLWSLLRERHESTYVQPYDPERVLPTISKGDTARLSDDALHHLAAECDLQGHRREYKLAKAKFLAELDRRSLERHRQQMRLGWGTLLVAFLSAALAGAAFIL